jgi:hypothetical protein
VGREAAWRKGNMYDTFLELSSLVHSIHTFFVIFMFIDNLATSIQVLLVVF